MSAREDAIRDARDRMVGRLVANGADPAAARRSADACADNASRRDAGLPADSSRIRASELVPRRSK